jgi:hypothetical protein
MSVANTAARVLGLASHTESRAAWDGLPIPSCSLTPSPWSASATWLSISDVRRHLATEGPRRRGDRRRAARYQEPCVTLNQSAPSARSVTLTRERLANTLPRPRPPAGAASGVDGGAHDFRKNTTTLQNHYNFTCFAELFCFSCVKRMLLLATAIMASLAPRRDAPRRHHGDCCVTL